MRHRILYNKNEMFYDTWLFVIYRTINYIP